jgi:hypothetical protein
LGVEVKPKVVGSSWAAEPNARKLKWKNIFITQLLYNIKKLHQFIFSLQYEKQLNKRKGKKNSRGKKIKIFIKSKEKK